VLDAANDVTSSREDWPKPWLMHWTRSARTETRIWKTTTGGNSRAVRGESSDRKPVDRITDRAKRYRAQKAIRVPGVVYFAARGADWT